MTRENLWAPWRMAYIRENARHETSADKHKACFLCSFRDQPALDAEHFVVHRSQHSMIVLNRFPYNNGHLLVAPLVHQAELTELSEFELLDLQKLISQCTACLKRELNCQGFNIGLNLGHVAGAGLPGHLHWHVVPRWQGDANFMDVVAETNVIPDSLQELHKILSSCF